MILSPAQNLVGFVASRPPLVIFILCLATFALTTFSLAFYVRTHDNIRNPDVKLDWNVFLGGVSKRRLCLTGNQSATHPAKDEFVSYSFLANVTLLLGPETKLHDVQAQAALFGVMKDSGIEIRLDLGSDVNSTSAYCVADGACSADAWQTACVGVRGPRSAFPAKWVRKGAPCSIPSATVAPRPLVAADGESNPCASEEWLRIKFLANPDWTVMLSMKAHSIIDLHLMHTTYFLLATVVTLLCYATIRGRPNRTSSNMMPGINNSKSASDNKSLLDGQV